MSKYDWSKVPKDVKWIATDEDGWAYGWVKKPHPIGFHEWLTKSKTGGLYDNFYLAPKKNPYKGNWQDSLEERPND